MFRNQSNNRHIPKPLKGLFFVAMVALFVFVLGNVIMFLWNEILVEKTGVQSLQFWEAIGLFVLFRILFGGFRFGPRNSHWRKKRKAWKQKWMGMSEEEKQEFKQKWKERCKTKN